MKNTLLKKFSDLMIVLDAIHDGVVLTDENGYIVYMNKPFCVFSGVDPAPWIGKHVTEFNPLSRMHIVAETGKPEFNKLHQIKGRNVLVHRIPIKNEGEIIAVFGQVIFKDINEIGELADKLQLLESKVKHYEKEILNLRSSQYTLESIVGLSKAILSLKREAFKSANTNFPVLITGESGTGKELFAHAIHHASIRKLHPFIRIDCTTIPKDLVEAELFGYTKGAFTGASMAGKPGKFELAHRGSVFLDEIGDLPLEMQPKLLRVLEEGVFERVGGTSPIRSDFRLIAATNQNLEDLVQKGRFRQDLFYRLNVIPLNIPPLRSRREDIPPLLHQILNSLNNHHQSGEVEIQPSALEALCNYDWPGNVRELRHVLERILTSIEEPTIGISDIPVGISDIPAYIAPKPALLRKDIGNVTLSDIVAKAERQAIQEVLEFANFNKAKTSKLLGIHRTHLYKKMTKYGLT